jgi:hypothetical protein
MRSTPHHILRPLAVALVAGAAMAPAAAADHQDLRLPDARDAVAGYLEPVTVDRPTERQTFPGMAQWAAPRQDLRMPDQRHPAAGDGGTDPPAEFVHVPVASGFDWGDAGIGAAAAIGVVLIGAGGALTLRRRPAAARL